MVFGWFKRKIINTVSSSREMTGLLAILRDDVRDLENQLAEKKEQIETIEKMIEAINN